MATDVKVRVYETGDEQDVVDLWELVFPDDPPWNYPADVIRNKLAFQPEWFFVCHSGDVLAGTVLAGYDGVRGWVQKVAVHPQFQRQGIASVLIKTAEDALAAVGCPKLNLQTRADNAAAIEFYKEAGYQVEDRVSMGKRLNFDR